MVTQWGSPKSVYCVDKYRPSSKHRTAQQRHWLLEWLITRHTILWLPVILYSNLKQPNIWAGLKYCFLKVLETNTQVTTISVFTRTKSKYHSHGFNNNSQALAGNFHDSTQLPNSRSETNPAVIIVENR